MTRFVVTFADGATRVVCAHDEIEAARVGGLFSFHPVVGVSRV